MNNNNFKIYIKKGFGGFPHCLESEIINCEFDEVQVINGITTLLIESFYETQLKGDFGDAVYAECLRIGING